MHSRFNLEWVFSALCVNSACVMGSEQAETYSRRTSERSGNEVQTDMTWGANDLALSRALLRADVERYFK